MNVWLAHLETGREYYKNKVAEMYVSLSNLGSLASEACDGRILPEQAQILAAANSTVALTF